MLLKKMKAFLAIALVTSLSLLTACGGGTAEQKAESSGETHAAEAVSAEEGGTIKLGVLAPLTGTNAEYGKGFQIAMQMAE